MFGFRIGSLLLIASSCARPTRISEYPGYENQWLLVRWTRLPSAGLPAIEPCARINVPQKNGINFSRRCLGRRRPVAFVERLVFRTLARLEL